MTDRRCDWAAWPEHPHTAGSCEVTISCDPVTVELHLCHVCTVGVEAHYRLHPAEGIAVSIRRPEPDDQQWVKDELDRILGLWKDRT